MMIIKIFTVNKLLIMFLCPLLCYYTGSFEYTQQISNTNRQD